MNDVLKNVFTEYWQYLAIVAACRLNLFDVLEKKCFSLDELVAKIGAKRKCLLNLLHALMNIDYLRYENGEYGLTDKSKLLTDDNPRTLKYACIHWAEEPMIAWQNLRESIISGKSYFEREFGKSYFSYLEDHPQKLIAYHKAMDEYARDDYCNLPNVIDFGIHKSLLDCGGGLGATINAVKVHYPQLQCFLFDRPKVVELSDYGEIGKIGGDFFNEIPIKVDAIILARVLHDWDNEKALRILNTCMKSVNDGGFLYVVENCTESIDDISFLSLNMAVFCESYERTSAEYRSLCSNAGFHFCEIKKLNALQVILVFRK